MLSCKKKYLKYKMKYLQLKHGGMDGSPWRRGSPSKDFTDENTTENTVKTCAMVGFSIVSLSGMIAGIFLSLKKT